MTILLAEDEILLLNIEKNMLKNLDETKIMTLFNNKITKKFSKSNWAKILLGNSLLQLNQGRRYVVSSGIIRK